MVVDKPASDPPAPAPPSCDEHDCQMMSHSAFGEHLRLHSDNPSSSMHRLSTAVFDLALDVSMAITNLPPAFDASVAFEISPAAASSPLWLCLLSAVAAECEDRCCCCRGGSWLSEPMLSGLGNDNEA